MLIKNAVFLVTGGASDAHGRATVELLLKEGARVVICDMPTKDLSIFGDDKAIFLPISICDEKDLETLARVIKDKYGRLDGVINCIDHHNPLPFQDTTLKDFKEIIYENLLGPFNINRFMIPLMESNIPKKGGGRGLIINMSNVAALEGGSASCPYSTSKAALIGMSEALNSELQGIQIRCISIVTSTIEQPKKFAELVKTVIQTNDLTSPVIKLDKVVQN